MVAFSCDAENENKIQLSRIEQVSAFLMFRRLKKRLTSKATVVDAVPAVPLLNFVVIYY